MPLIFLFGSGSDGWIDEADILTVISLAIGRNDQLCTEPTRDEVIITFR